MDQALDLFQHRFIDNNADQTLFLLHGTGGTAEDFLFLDEIIGEKYNLVGLQGNIDEDGLTRFFRRISLNVFDQESIAEETQKLAAFLESWMTTHDTTVDQLCFLGYSNGANMILAMLLKFPEFIHRAALLHPMLPFPVEPSSIKLADRHIFVSTGAYDRMIPPAEQRKVIATLKELGAQVTVGEYEAGHEITRQEMSDLVQFLRK